MCGIAGYFGAGDQVLLDALARLLVHRGPDGGGSWVGPGVGLTMRRLAIIDLAGGQQPIASADSRMQLVFNGELYNYRELRAAHLGGVAFQTASDTEVVLRMYEAFGEAAFAMFNGMYAIALYDGRSGSLYLVRDRLGLKPLYYHVGAERLTFSSELKSLLQDPQVPRRLDHRALAAYLTWQYVPGPATILADVAKLPPGTFMRVTHGRPPEFTTYWQPQIVRPARSRVDDLPAVLGAAVKRQMVSDVPVGAFLSGGLDSSLVVALMREHAGSRLQTFTASFDDPRLDEAGWAAEVARHLDVDHEIVRLDDSALDELPHLAWHLDEPIADRAALPTLLLARAAASRVKVVLTGEGSDELFGGYPRYRLERWARRFHQLPGASRRQLWQRITKILPASLRGRVAKIVLSPADPARRREAWLANFEPEARGRLLKSPAPVEALPAVPDETLATQLLLDMRGWLVDNVLMKVDKTTMAASLEARVPFLDHEVVDWALGLADEDKLRGETTKFAVKQAAVAVLPAPIIHRPKQGFHTPTAAWFRAPRGRDMALDLLTGERARARGLFDIREVEGLVARHQAGEALDQPIWNLLILELWLQAFLDRPPAPL